MKPPKNTSSRRKFLLGSMTGISSAWIAVNWPAILQAKEQAARITGEKFTFFNSAQATDIDAMTAQIFPTTDTPGAREAQVLYFIDLALMSFAQDSQPVYVKGFVELQAKVSEMFPGSKSFAMLAPAQQIQLLTAIEKTPFFVAVRNHTMMGMFSSPQHGGNYNKIGWKLIGFDDSLNFKPPFGAYDH